MVLRLLLHGVEESYPRRQGDEGRILEEGLGGAAYDKLTKQGLPFGDGTRGVETEQEVWGVVMRMHIIMTHAGRCRHDQQDGHSNAPDV
jgi:hypothetical protein